MLKVNNRSLKLKRFSGKRFTAEKLQRWNWSDQFELELILAVIEFWLHKLGPYPKMLCQYGCLRSCPFLFLYPNCPYMLYRYLWREIIYANS